jgi:hypothetical protein
MPTEYNSHILKFDLHGQDMLKNDAERCSAGLGMLQSIGRAVDHQVRMTRSNHPKFFALCMAAQADRSSSRFKDTGRANEAHTGLTGRERLGTPDKMKAVVQAAVVNAEPPHSETRLFETVKNDGEQTYFIAIAPHGDDIEKHTGDEAELLRSELASNGYPAICKGLGDEFMGVLDRWQISPTDLNPESFPLLKRIATRKFCYGVAFHGFSKPPEDADFYIGGDDRIRLRKRSGASSKTRICLCRSGLPRMTTIRNSRAVNLRTLLTGLRHRASISSNPPKPGNFVIRSRKLS